MKQEIEIANDIFAFVSLSNFRLGFLLIFSFYPHSNYHPHHNILAIKTPQNNDFFTRKWGRRRTQIVFLGARKWQHKAIKEIGFCNVVRTFYALRNFLIVAPEFIFKFVVAASFCRNLLVLISKLARPIYQKGKIWGATFLAKAKPLNLTCFPVKA